MEELNPCPWCNSDDLCYRTDRGEVEFVHCVTCKSNGPKVKGTREQVAAAWNHRASGGKDAVFRAVKEKLIAKAVEFLEEYSGVLSNNGCNDLDEDFYDGWSDEEKEALIGIANQWNGHDEKENGEYDNLINYDWVICLIVADLLKKEIQEVKN